MGFMGRLFRKQRAVALVEVDTVDVTHAPDDDGHAIATASERPRTARLITPHKPAGSPPRPARRTKPPSPFKMWPNGTAESQRARGDGFLPAEVTLQRPSPGQPILLVVRLRWASQSARVSIGPPSRRTALLRRSKRHRRVVIALPASEEHEVHLAIDAHSDWWAWLQPVDSAPVLHDRLGAEGGFVFRYDGGPARIRMRHTTPGAFSVIPLTPTFEQDEPLLSGKGNVAVEADLKGPTYIQVHAAGAWAVDLL